MEISETTAAQQLSAIAGSPKLAKRLRAGARRVQDELLCPDCLMHYWRHLFDGIRRQFQQAAVLDSDRALRELLTDENCTRLELGVVEAGPVWEETNEFWLRPLSGSDDPSDPFSVCARPQTKGSSARPPRESNFCIGKRTDPDFSMNHSATRGCP